MQRNFMISNSKRRRNPMNFVPKTPYKEITCADILELAHRLDFVDRPDYRGWRLRAVVRFVVALASMGGVALALFYWG